MELREVREGMDRCAAAMVLITLRVMMEPHAEREGSNRPRSVSWRRRGAVGEEDDRPALTSAGPGALELGGAHPLDGAGKVVENRWTDLAGGLGEWGAGGFEGVLDVLGERGLDQVHGLAKRLRAKHHLSGFPRPPNVLHVSLLGIAGLDPQVIAQAKKAADSIVMQPFTVWFNRAMSFQNVDERPIVLVGDVEAIDGFSHLRNSLNDAVRAAGLSSDGGGFKPHATLLYDQAEMPAEFIDTISWTVRDFRLIHSVVGETRYIDLGVWPLRG